MRPLTEAEQKVFHFVWRYLQEQDDETLARFGINRAVLEEQWMNSIRIACPGPCVNWCCCKLYGNKDWKHREHEYAAGMTLRNLVILTRQPLPQRSDKNYYGLLAHELTHVFQAHTRGFWWRLVKERLQHGFRKVYGVPGTLEHSADLVERAYKNMLVEEDIELLV